MSECDVLTPREQLQWYFDQAKLGDIEAKRELGRMHFLGFTHPDDSDVEIAPDAKKAKKYLTEAADEGDGEAAYLLGTLYDGEATGGLFDNPSEAFRRYQQAVDLDYRPALSYLGSRYLLGRGIERNDRLGREMLIEAAYAGDYGAQRVVSGIFAKDGDKATSIAWRIAAATFNEDCEGDDMPKKCPRRSPEIARLLIQKINVYSVLVNCDAPELIKAGDLLRECFVSEI